MTAYSPLYRLTCYSPRSVDIDEATVLVPRAGSLHADPFRVATKGHGRAVRIGQTIARYFIRNPVGTWPTTELSVEFVGRLDSGLNEANQNAGVSYSRQTVQFNEFLCWIGTNAVNWRQELLINGTSVTAGTNHPNDNKYHHLGFRWRSSDGAWTMFRDGVNVAAGTGLQTGYSLAAGGIAVIGQDQDSAGGGFDSNQAWKGEMDEVRVYSRYLSDLEFKQHAGGIYIDETGLCARWGFDLDGVPALGRDSVGLNDLTPVGIDAGTDDTILHFKPYLRTPEGLHGIFDPLTRNLDTGVMTAGLVDRQLTPGQNLQRWVTSFLGNTRNQNQFLGLKARWEESLDNGFTWASFFTGRIDMTKLNEKNAYNFDCVDGADELDVDICVERPHASLTYTAPAQVWPLGSPIQYGGIQPALPIKGVIQAASGFVASAGIKSVLVNQSDIVLAKNRMSSLLESVSGSFIMGTDGQIGPWFGAYFPEGITYSSRARVKLKRLDTLATGQFQLGVVRHTPVNAIKIFDSLSYKVLEVVLAPVAASDGAFLAMPPNGTSVEISVVLIEKPTDEAPIYIQDVHVVQLLQDLLLGKFGRLNPDGTVLQAFTPEPTSFATLIADQTIPTFRGRITGKETLRSFVQKALLQPPFNLGWRLDADGRVVVFDTRRPSTLAGVGTIADGANGDLIEAKDAFKWEQGRRDAITQLEVLYYVDVPMSADGAVVTAFDGRIATLLIRPLQQNVIDATFGRADLGQKRVTFDAVGFRAMPGEIVRGQSRMTWLKRMIAKGMEEIRPLFASGPAYGTVRCRRNTNTRSWQIGQIKIVDVDAMPDPTTGLRGGPRVMLAVARDERKQEIDFRVLDLGPNTIAGVPTFSGLVTDTNDTAHGVTITATLNGSSDPIELYYAVTDTAVVVRPLDTDPLWTFGARVTVTGAVTIINLPAGKKIWVGGRSVPATDGSEAKRFPSARNYPVTDNVTLTAITAPSALATTELTGRRVVVTFTAGDVRLPIEVLLATPTSDPRVSVKTAPPGSTRIELNGLQLSTTYRVGLQHRDALGGTSSEATLDFTTTGTAALAPDPGGILISIGAA